MHIISPFENSAVLCNVSKGFLRNFWSPEQGSGLCRSNLWEKKLNISSFYKILSQELCRGLVLQSEPVAEFWILSSFLVREVLMELNSVGEKALCFFFFLPCSSCSPLFEASSAATSLSLGQKMHFPPSYQKKRSSTGVVVAEARNSYVDIKIKGWQVTRPILCLLRNTVGKRVRTHVASLKKGNPELAVCIFFSPFCS